MEATPVYHRLPRRDASPEETLRAFRAAYPLDEVQAALWQCLQPRLLNSLKARDAEATNQTALYAHLEILLAAIYQLPLPAEAPLAAALDSLSQQVSHNWVLLICPPE